MSRCSSSIAAVGFVQIRAVPIARIILRVAMSGKALHVPARFAGGSEPPPWFGANFTARRANAITSEKYD